MKCRYLLIILSATFLFSACRKEEAPVPHPAPIPSESTAVKIIHDEIGTTPVVLAGSEGLDLVVAFDRRVEGKAHHFTAIQGALPLIMIDDQGNKWDIFGRAVEGPQQGATLNSLNSGMGYWFIFGAMYPGVDIFNGPSRKVVFSGDSRAGWGIPTRNVFRPIGSDGIPSIDAPDFVTYNLRTFDGNNPFFLNDRDLIMAVSVNGETKVYPHRILDRHEIVNDVVGGLPIAVTYCPLTGTGRVWERTLADGRTTTFGVSGFLYNCNIVPYDRATGSLWTQLDNRSVYGPRLHETKQPIPFVETTWRTWLLMFNRPLVLSGQIGFDRRYEEYPYGDYRTNHQYLPYPLDVDDDRLRRKERVFGIASDDRARVYRMGEF